MLTPLVWISETLCNRRGQRALLTRAKRRPLVLEQLEDRIVPTIFAMPDSFSMVHDHGISAVNILANDYNSNPDPLTATLISGPTHGSFTLTSNGDLTYTPSAGFAGVDSLTYQAAADGESSQVTVNFNVTNATPWLMGQYFSLSHDHALDNINLLLWASDGDGDPLQLNIVTNVAHGQLTQNANGLWKYTPATHWTGTDSLTATVTDGIAVSSETTFSFAVSNSVPMISSQQFNVVHGQVISNLNPLANAWDADGDTLQVTFYGQPSHGQLTANGDGTWTYVAPTDWAGTETFNVMANDGIADSNLATITIDITNQPPAAMSDEFSTPHDQALGIDGWNGVLVNDVDAEGDPLTATIAAQPQHGSVTLNSDGGFTYTPTAGYVGDDSFSYTASDGMSQSGTATVMIHVTNDVPVPEADEFYLHAGLILSLDATDGVMKNDYDAGFDALTVEQVGANPAHGTLTLNADGSFTYQANASFVGDDYFSYRLSDGVSESNSVMVTIHVQNATPDGTVDDFDVWSAAGISAGQANVMDNDGDADGDAMTVVIDMPPTYADSFQLNSDGSFSYVPNITGPQGANFADFFTYKLFDGTTYSAPVMVSLHVTDTPVAKDDGYVLDASGQLTVAAADGVLKNEFNPMNAQLAVGMVQAPDPNVATVVLQPDGSFSVTPGPNFAGEAIFIYAINQIGNQAVNGIQTTVRTFTSALSSSFVGLKSVSFLGNAIVQKDDGGPYAGPQWLDQNTNGDATDAGDHQTPISFTKDSTIFLWPTFKVNPLMASYWRSRANDILVRATTDVPGLQLNLGFNQTIHLAMNAQNELSTLFFVQMDSALPNFTNYIQYFDLVWSISPDNGQTWLTPTIANTSRNEAFVTLANPNGWVPLLQLVGVQPPAIPHSVFIAGKGTAAGATNQDQLVADVFQAFQDRTITRADGTPMTYYGNWNTTSVNTEDLLRGGANGDQPDGDCVTWSNFFIDVLRAQGASVASRGAQSNRMEIRTSQQARNAGDIYFIVKDWTFGNANIQQLFGNRPVPFTHFNETDGNSANPASFVRSDQDPNFQNDETRRINWRYSWIGNPAVTDQEGISGQNSANPASLFGRHEIIKIANTLYDPSYGVTYDWAANSELGDFQTKALAGYAGFWRVLQGGILHNYVLFEAAPAGNADQWLVLDQVR